ncbi:hypothetical protein TNCV_1358951 [Trichonephila clavipes]|nr:hypothetical protein TNCV_1358951 [Trichonephila clavipes]
MANYSKCPLFPKPRKGTTTGNNYSTVVDSIVRPNTTYAQVTNNKKPDQHKITQQMAPRANLCYFPANQTNRLFTKPLLLKNSTIENSPQFAIVQTLQQMTMHTLAILTQQIASLSFNALAPPTQKTNRSQKRIKRPNRLISTKLTMISLKTIGLKLCSWNANGILNKISEFKIFVKKYSPDLLLIQETHLRPHHTINIQTTTATETIVLVTDAQAAYFLILTRKMFRITISPPPPLNHIEATSGSYYRKFKSDLYNLCLRTPVL